MKRLVLSILVIAFLLCTAGCGAQNEEDSLSYPVNDIDFSEYLDNINFSHGISQGDFISIMQNYSYNGVSITDILIGTHYDNAYGGGYFAKCRQFGFQNDYQGYDVTKRANYQNMLYTGVMLEGLILPSDVTFDDSIRDVFEKLGIDIDPDSGFVPDKNEEWNMTLQNIDGKSFVLTDCRRMTETAGKQLYDYKLEYKEIYEAIRDDGRNAEVTRSVIMSFNDNGKLSEFRVAVNEEFDID